MAAGKPSLPLRMGIATVSLLIGAAIWLPTVHFLFRPQLAEFRQSNAVAPQARALAARHLKLWEDPVLRQAEIGRMRQANAEWDFMGRTYFVLALANMALDEPQQQGRYLKVIDAIIDETLDLEKTRGMYFFLMHYARQGTYIGQPARSTFIDGEIAMMLAARQLVSVRSEYAPLLAQRTDLLIRYMSRSKVLCGESYPDECWLFCNAVAAAAIRMSDRLDGRDHSAFLASWLEMIKAKLIDKKTGMLVSSFTYNGKPLDGPEGSSIWMIVHCLQIVDPAFAQEQYRLAREQLGRSVVGFGYCREWPALWPGKDDVDSGPTVPILGANAGASGLAVLGAASFGDDAYLRQLLTTLEFAAFPSRRGDQLRYDASNQVGDAVLLYAMVEGPLWRRTLEPREKRP